MTDRDAKRAYTSGPWRLVEIVPEDEHGPALAELIWNGVSYMLLARGAIPELLTVLMGYADIARAVVVVSKPPPPPLPVGRPPEWHPPVVDGHLRHHPGRGKSTTNPGFPVCPCPSRRHPVLTRNTHHRSWIGVVGYRPRLTPQPTFGPVPRAPDCGVSHYLPRLV